MSAALLAAQAIPTGQSGEKAKSFVFVLVAVVVVILVVFIIYKVFGGIDSFLEAIGVKDTKDRKEDDASVEKSLDDSAKSTSPWNPNFYKSAPAGTELRTTAFVDTLATQINNSVGVIYDDPENGLAAIRQCPNQATVSFLVDRFQVKYNADLLNWLYQKYDRDNQRKVLATIVSYVNNLKKY